MFYRKYFFDQKFATNLVEATTTTATPTTTTTTTTAEIGDVVDVATAAGNFKTLVQLLNDLELVDALRDATAQTIFAPSDEAFAKLPEGTLENLSKEEKLAMVLRHVHGGTTVLASDVATGRVVTLGDEKINLIKTVVGGVQIFYMNNLIKVVTADVKASNGVIHVIDAVIYSKGT